MTATQANRPSRTLGVRGTALAIALVLCLAPILWTALAAFGIEPNNASSPPSWKIAPSLEHLAEVGSAEPAFWQELATSLGVSAAAAVCSPRLRPCPPALPPGVD